MTDNLSSTNDAAILTPMANGTVNMSDVEMRDEHPTEPQFQTQMASPLPPAGSADLAPPAQQPQSRTQTPPARASPHPPPASIPAPPTQPNLHGSPTRVYLNQNVTPYLLEGVKYLAVYEPEKPLKWLSEFLERKSREVEGA